MLYCRGGGKGQPLRRVLQEKKAVISRKKEGKNVDKMLSAYNNPRKKNGDRKRKGKTISWPKKREVVQREAKKEKAPLERNLLGEKDHVHIS